jgi:biotin transport system permease protein/energy-coupling factor transport system permease protein
MPLLLSILRRSDELVDAMEARGYQPGSRSYLYETELTRGEYIVITTLVILTAAIMIYPVV